MEANLNKPVFVNGNYYNTVIIDFSVFDIFRPVLEFLPGFNSNLDDILS